MACGIYLYLVYEQVVLIPFDVCLVRGTSGDSLNDNARLTNYEFQPCDTATFFKKNWSELVNVNTTYDQVATASISLFNSRSELIKTTRFADN